MRCFMTPASGKRDIRLSDRGRSIRSLSGKPEERRELFDEAAGIVKFKRRKNLSVRKLDEEQTEPDPCQ